MTRTEKKRPGDTGAASAGRDPEHRRLPTLLGLIEVVQDLTESDEEAVAVVFHLLSSGRVVFGGRPVQLTA